jgi:hypothetical protein
MSFGEKPLIRLSAAQRAKLVPDIDVDALERFLQHVATTSEDRDALLRTFTQGKPNRSVQLLGTADDDPTIRALLDEVWAPTWIKLGPDAIAHSDSRLPGRELARAKLRLTMPPKE